MAVKAIPDGYPRVTPMMIASPAEELITFLKEVLGAHERLRMPMPNGSIGHCELTVGDGLIMVADAMEPYVPNQCGVHVYVDDVDATYQKALALGSTSLTPPEDMFYGDRSAAVRDRFGNTWSFARHVEDMSEEEMRKRMDDMFGKMPQP